MPYLVWATLLLSQFTFPRVISANREYCSKWANDVTMRTVQSKKRSFFELSEMLLIELCDRLSMFESRRLTCQKKGR